MSHVLTVLFPLLFTPIHSPLSGKSMLSKRKSFPISPLIKLFNTILLILVLKNFKILTAAVRRYVHCPLLHSQDSFHVLFLTLHVSVTWASCSSFRWGRPGIVLPSLFTWITSHFWDIYFNIIYLEKVCKAPD